MSEFNFSEFFELKAAAQVMAIKKIDNKDVLRQIRTDSKYKTAQDAVDDRLSELFELEAQKAEKLTKDGIDREAVKAEAEAKAEAEKEAEPEVEDPYKNVDLKTVEPPIIKQKYKYPY